MQLYSIRCLFTFRSDFVWKKSGPIKNIHALKRFYVSQPWSDYGVMFAMVGWRFMLALLSSGATCCLWRINTNTINASNWWSFPISRSVNIAHAERRRRHVTPGWRTVAACQFPGAGYRNIGLDLLAGCALMTMHERVLEHPDAIKALSSWSWEDELSISTWVLRALPTTTH